MVDELPGKKIISPKKITTATKAQLKLPLTSSPSQHLAASWECLGYNMMSLDLFDLATIVAEGAAINLSVSECCSLRVIVIGVTSELGNAYEDHDHNKETLCSYLQ